MTTQQKWQSLQRYSKSDFSEGTQELQDDSESGTLPETYTFVAEAIRNAQQQHSPETLNQMPPRARQSFYELLGYMAEISEEGQTGRTIQQFISDSVQHLSKTVQTQG